MSNFEYLDSEQINNLSDLERREYIIKKLKYEWEKKTPLEKDSSVRDDCSYYVGRRDIGSETLEEVFELIKAGKQISESYIKILEGIFPFSITDYHQRILSGEKFTFFWETFSPFSQWHKSTFSATTLILDGTGDFYEIKRKDLLQGLFPFDVQVYSSAEQFMMYHKAMIFLDREAAKKIMGTVDARKIKEYGREVKSFDANIWKYYRSKIVYEGNKAKFMQNDNLKKELFDTTGSTLVEASPNDSIWGIGLAKDNPKAQQRNTWEGKNLLGEILTSIRIELMGHY